MFSRMIGCLLALLFLMVTANAQLPAKITTVATNGWANNAVNTVIFRKNALVTYQNTQFTSYYDADQYVVLAKRQINSENWIVSRTQYKADATDAHKSISIIIDGKGYLHIAWGQHNNKLNYAQSIAPGSLTLGSRTQMVGAKEERVSYPEFYALANGDILFLYRDGGSGNGDLVINRYDSYKGVWSRVQDNLIDGEGKRNAYWQAAVDQKGTIHISWVWRESPDVASNHDLCYAKSEDGGVTWKKSNSEPYQLPINEANAEYAFKIPQQRELINQTAMYADDLGNPFIAGYWRDPQSIVPQYHIVYHLNDTWTVLNLNFRKTPFTLNGMGTKQIPISRPQLVTWKNKKSTAVALIFRDIERTNKVSIITAKNIEKPTWVISDLTSESVGDWEPNYDVLLWKKKRRLDLFVQQVEQVDGEGKATKLPTPIQVLTWLQSNH
ncbi:BNR repeat-containing protein [Pedobacter insulae]|uniref:BNR repeat-containing family member n=1 Tax=Pedobacter insulae TaxID=414048 RepID=A0A1I2ZA21_9SPHI|nr:BNR repeat-containing protein [Pedobacter insulae]SFH34356.1 BNR repeat-containing family member [Pedobacter insulae]